MIHQQPQYDWTNPLQSLAPAIPTDSDQLVIINDNLLEALNYLTFCHHYLESSGLSKQYTDLFSAVSESLDSCTQAIEKCDGETTND